MRMKIEGSQALNPKKTIPEPKFTTQIVKV